MWNVSVFFPHYASLCSWSTFFFFLHHPLSLKTGTYEGSASSICTYVCIQNICILRLVDLAVRVASSLFFFFFASVNHFTFLPRVVSVFQTLSRQIEDHSADRFFQHRGLSGGSDDIFFLVFSCSSYLTLENLSCVDSRQTRMDLQMQLQAQTRRH